MIVQKIKTTDSIDFERARKYFAVISALNNLYLSNLALNFLAFLATRAEDGKEIFCQEFDSSIYSVNNTIHKLKKKGLLTKLDHKLLITKQLSLDFSQDVVLQISLNATKGEII